MSELRKCRVLFVITTLELGGAQKNALDLAQGLDNKKYEKYFVSSPGWPLQKEAQSLKDVKSFPLPFLKRQISPFFDLFCIFWIWNFIKKNHIEIVHTHSSKAGMLGRWAAKLGGVDIIIHSVHGWSFNAYSGRLGARLFIFLEKVTANITTCLITVAKSDIDKGRQNGIGKLQQYKRIKPGIQLKCFATATTQNDLKARLNLAAESKVVGMIACFKPQKNVKDFINAAALIIQQNPNTYFCCVGDGKLHNALEAQARNLNLGKNILFLGWRKDIAELLQLFDIVCLTSLWEGLPIALIEAMASSKAIVAYSVDGVKELVDDGVNGYLCKPGDVKLFASKVSSLLNDEKLRKHMGQAAREKFLKEDFSKETMYKKMHELYAELLSEK